MSLLSDIVVEELTFPSNITFEGDEYDISQYVQVCVPQKLTVSVKNYMHTPYLNVVRRSLIQDAPAKRLIMKEFSQADMHIIKDNIRVIISSLPVPDNIAVGTVYRIEVENRSNGARKTVMVHDLINEATKEPFPHDDVELFDLGAAKINETGKIARTAIKLKFVVEEHSSLEGGIYESFMILPTSSFDDGQVIEPYSQYGPFNYTMFAINNGNGDIKKQWNFAIDNFIERLHMFINRFDRSDSYKINDINADIVSYFIEVPRADSTISYVMKYALDEVIPHDECSFNGVMDYKETDAEIKVYLYLPELIAQYPPINMEDRFEDAYAMRARRMTEHITSAVEHIITNMNGLKIPMA